MTRRPWATLNLGFHLCALLFRKRRGLSAFFASYRQDRVPPYTREEKELLPLASRCIACGLCDSLCPTIGTLSQKFLPSFLPHWSRSVPDFSLGLPDFASCSDCRGCEAICPTQVPLQRIVQFMKDKIK